MTIQEVLNECAVWEHSKEHYELMKECAEVKLMEQYVSDQIFMLESANNSIFQEAYANGMFMECAFFEADDEDAGEDYVGNAVAAIKNGVNAGIDKGKQVADRSIVAIKNVANEAVSKTKTIWGKIKSGIKKVINAIVRFFKWLFRIKPIDEKLTEFAQTHDFTPEEVAKISQIYQSAMGEALGNDTNNAGLKIQIEKKLNANVNIDTNRILALAIGKPVTIHKNGSRSKFKNAVDPIAFMNSLSVFKPSYGLDKLIEDLKGLVAQPTLTFEFGNKELNEQIKTNLDVMENKFDDIIKFIDDSVTEEGQQLGQLSQQLMDFNDMIKSFSVSTVQLYHGLYNTAEQVRKMLSGMRKAF